MIVELTSKIQDLFRGRRVRFSENEKWTIVSDFIRYHNIGRHDIGSIDRLPTKINEYARTYPNVFGLYQKSYGRILGINARNIHLITNELCDHLLQGRTRSPRNVPAFDKDGKFVSFTNEIKAKELSLNKSHEYKLVLISDIKYQYPKCMHNVRYALLLSHNVRTFDTTISNYEYISKRQGGVCNGCGLHLTNCKAEFHHRFIPRWLFTMKYSLWNLELLCHSCHVMKHKSFYSQLLIFLFSREITYKYTIYNLFVRGNILMLLTKFL